VKEATKTKRFISEEEEKFGTEFAKYGRVICEVADYEALNTIKEFIIQACREYIGPEKCVAGDLLNDTHEFVSVNQLNNFRLRIIEKINSNSDIRLCYFRLAKPYLDIIVGNELAMQARLNLSIQMPGDNSSLLPVHADVWSGDSPYEVVVWLPLVNCSGTKSMFLLPPNQTNQALQRPDGINSDSSEQLFKLISKEVEWIDINYGQVMLFNQNLPHGNRINTTKETRWSINCRFKALFSPYGDKRLGEFFVPITVKPASRIGLNYRYPKMQDE